MTCPHCGSELDLIMTGLWFCRLCRDCIGGECLIRHLQVIFIGAGVPPPLSVVAGQVPGLH